MQYRFGEHYALTFTRISPEKNTPAKQARRLAFGYFRRHAPDAHLHLSRRQDSARHERLLRVFALFPPKSRRKTRRRQKVARAQPAATSIFVTREPSKPSRQCMLKSRRTAACKACPAGEMSLISPPQARKKPNQTVGLSLLAVERRLRKTNLYAYSFPA